MRELMFAERLHACVNAGANPLSAIVDPKRSTTLGNLLYADRAETISEAEWVQIVEAISHGDQDALRALYERAHRIVFTLAMRICGTREAAEEVMLDVFHAIWRRSAQYDPAGGTVVGWIMMQTRSRALDRVRFDQRKKRVDPGIHEDVETDGPSHAIESRQQRERLDDALCTLTPHERTAIETAFFSELTYSETAARLDEPIGTVKTRVRSALAKLRKALGGDS